ncbi:hypothetical protein RF11_11769 [Thelohanellus kitauei]|uniref:Uncharacterized protein n=1 Tax=Thelohanellus kitauei TaxID=669202 RepID=A0A0C2MF70_THEKT|nr:hypothetical protein RF11_11769 [Thelohanellus kitauei]
MKKEKENIIKEAGRVSAGYSRGFEHLAVNRNFNFQDLSIGSYTHYIKGLLGRSKFLYSMCRGVRSTISQHQRARSDIKEATSAPEDRRAPLNTEKNSGRQKATDTLSLNGAR